MKAPRNLSNFPQSSDHLGWHRYYAMRYDYWAKKGNEQGMKQCAQLATWYQMLCLRDEQWPTEPAPN